MDDSKHPDRDPNEGSRATVGRQPDRDTGAEWNESESGGRVPKSGASRRPDPIHTGDSADRPKKPYGLTESVDDRGSGTRHYDGKDSTAGTGKDR